MYTWIIIVGGCFAFFTAMGIGANDAANAFATSVGSKALTIKQAVVLAAIFETAGAILMGNHVTDTIRKGIADYRCFEDNPNVLMYGCMWVILAVGLWRSANDYDGPGIWRTLVKIMVVCYFIGLPFNIFSISQFGTMMEQFEIQVQQMQDGGTPNP